MVKTSRSSCPELLIADLIREKRLEMRLLPEQVVAYLDGTSLDQLRAYESGEKAVPLRVLYALSNCLNIPPSVIQALNERMSLLEGRNRAVPK